MAVEDRGEATTVTIRYFQLGQNAFIYIQKSQVKYTYILLTFDARVNGSHARVVVVFLRAETARVHRGTGISPSV